MHMHVCVRAKSLRTHTYTELRNRQRFIGDSCNVNKVGMVNRNSVGCRRDGGERPKAMGSVGIMLVSSLRSSGGGTEKGNN